jgi:hypothetical protein
MTGLRIPAEERTLGAAFSGLDKGMCKPGAKSKFPSDEAHDAPSDKT